MNNISSDYFMENKDKDYSSYLERSKEKILHIHGMSDDVVPFESVNIDLNNILIKEGNHNLERPDMIEQWIKPIIKFIEE